MKYDESLIHITDKLCESNTMYSLILLDAKSLNLTLSGYRCFLDGKYIVCLNIEDTLSIHGGYYEAVNLRFQPYFYNINLNHDVIGMEFYDEMREKYGYPDFRLFRMRTEDFFGIVPISDNEYKTAELYYSQAKRNIDTHVGDILWSCRARSDIISILHIAEGAYLGKQMGLENEILRYIHDNIGAEITLESLCSSFNTNRTSVSALIKEKTGLPPMKYVMEVRLNQSRPDLLFTRVPINEIASKYGFSDANYYIRSFKKRFGKSPLQFRKEGWDERIRDEGIYQRRAEIERTDMTVKEFCDYFNKGLGRAIIRLKKQNDKAPFRDAFFDLLFDENCVRHRRLGVYEKEIIDVFDDEEFTEKIADGFLKKLSEEENYGVYQGAVPLLVLLGYREKTEKIVEQRYRDAYSRLLEYTKKPWDGEKYPSFACIYMSTASTLSRYLKVGDERIKQILFDIADLYDHCQSPVIPVYQNPLYAMWDGVGREHFFLILDEVIKEHRNGKCIDIRKDMVFGEDVIAAAPTAAEILEHDELDQRTIKLLEGFKYADKETVLEIADAAVSEKNIGRKIYLLNFFILTGAPEEIPVEFPLDPEPLIKWAEEEGFEIRNEPPYGMTEAVLGVLCNMRHPAARRVAMKLFFDAERTGDIHFYAIQMRFGKNYVPEEDKSDFAAILRSQNAAERDTAIGVFIRDLTLGIRDLPMDLIPYIFANAHTHHRIELCQVLVKSELMPEELKNECMYDANKGIRELFLKTQKPKKAR